MKGPSCPACGERIPGIWEERPPALPGPASRGRSSDLPRKIPPQDTVVPRPRALSSFHCRKETRDPMEMKGCWTRT